METNRITPIDDVRVEIYEGQYKVGAIMRSGFHNVTEAVEAAYEGSRATHNPAPRPATASTPAATSASSPKNARRPSGARYGRRHRDLSLPPTLCLQFLSPGVAGLPMLADRLWHSMPLNGNRLCRKTQPIAVSIILCIFTRLILSSVDKWLTKKMH